jgi:hypothetical protein
MAYDPMIGFSNESALEEYQVNNSLTTLLGIIFHTVTVNINRN